MVEHGHPVALATVQAGDVAAVLGGAAAEQTGLRVLQCGRVGAHVWPAAPGDQRLIGPAVQGGDDTVWRTRRWWGDDTVSVVSLSHLSLKTIRCIVMGISTSDSV